jgi:multisubunit Na+/H+ antiporter MnhG subunit
MASTWKADTLNNINVIIQALSVILHFFVLLNVMSLEFIFCYLFIFLCYSDLNLGPHAF